MSRLQSYPYGIIADAMRTAIGGTLLLIGAHWLGLVLGIVLTGQWPLVRHLWAMIILIQPIHALFTIQGWLLYPLIVVTWLVIFTEEEGLRLKAGLLGAVFWLSALCSYSLVHAYS